MIVALYLTLFCLSPQESQNEAFYLRENRGELIEELGQTIVQKVKWAWIRCYIAYNQAYLLPVHYVYEKWSKSLLRNITFLPHLHDENWWKYMVHLLLFVQSELFAKLILLSFSVRSLAGEMLWLRWGQNMTTAGFLNTTLTLIIIILPTISPQDHWKNK